MYGGERVMIRFIRFIVFCEGISFDRFRVSTWDLVRVGVRCRVRVSAGFSYI